MGLAEPQDGLDYCPESWRVSPALFAEVRQGCGVVREERHQTTPEKRKKTLNRVKYHQKFPVVDGKAGAITIPQA